MYATPSENYISSNLSAKALSYLFNTVCNISAILGDTDGRVTKATATELTKSVDISAPGMILSNTEDIKDFESPIIESEVYSPEVSYETYVLYLGLKSGSSDYVLDISADAPLNSPLLMLSRETHTPAYVALRGLYLEAFSIYTSVLKYKTVDPIQTARVRSNCVVISSHIAKNSTASYDLLEVIKTLKLSLMYLDHYSSLLPE